MGKLKSERERKLQRKLIPVNIIVCIIALVAALSLFLLPILKIDVGRILRDDGVMEFVEEKIDGTVDETVDGTEQEDVNYKPVVTMLVKNVLGKAEGEISVSALSAFNVVTGSGDKTQIVMDNLLFGKNALATSLINSIVDAVVNIFETQEGKDLLEETVISVMAKALLSDVDDEAISDAFTTQNIKELVNILRDLGNPDKVVDGKVDEVADRFVAKIESMLGSEIEIDDDVKEDLTAEVQKMYDETNGYLKEGETLSIESIICVTVSKNIDLNTINIEEIFDNIFGENNGEENNEGSVHINAVDEELDGEGEIEVGGQEGEEGGTVAEQTIVTNYADLLLEIGFDKEKKEDLKSKLNTNLNALLSDFVADNGIDGYMGYYEYIFYGMLVFIGPWIILFLFSFFHLLAKNKRFMMWYVKLLCWIPPLIWLVLKLFPIAASKVDALNEMWNGENSVMIKAIFSSISSYTWISGLCYVLLWLISIFWAFPIKHKIRKERKNPEVEDAYDDDYDDYDY